MYTYRRNYMLDFIKGISCMTVVLIHITFPERFGEFIRLVCEYAVPVFLMITGYYSFGCNEKKLANRRKKIIKILIFAYVIFLCVNCLMAIKNGYFYEWIHENFSIITPIYYVVFCYISFAIPLWYLIAQVEIYLLWGIVVRNGKEHLLTKAIPILLVLHVSLTTICETFGYEWFLRTNFITRALPWFLIGYYIHTISEERISAIDDRILICGLIGGGILACLPFTFNLKWNFSCIGYIPFSTSIFLLGIKFKNVSLSTIVEYIGMNLSAYVYIFHIPMVIVLDVIANRLIGSEGKMYSLYTWLRPITAIIITVAFSYMFVMMKKVVQRHVYSSK